MDIKKTVIIKASAKQAWQVLGEGYGEVGTWIVSLSQSSMEGEVGVGGIRVCTGLGFGPFPASVVKERLIDFDAQSYSFRYEAFTGLPAIIKSAQNAWKIDPQGQNQCCIKMHAQIQLKWWARPLGILIPWLMAKDFNLLEEEMVYRIEQGRPHPRKLKALSTAGAA